MSFVTKFSLDRSVSVEEEKRDAISAAEELGYITKFPEIVDRIKKAKSSNEISLIMRTYRKRYFED